MMKKLKKIIMPLMLGAFMCGGVLPGLNVMEPVAVHANDEISSKNTPNGTHGTIPEFGFNSNGLVVPSDLTTEKTQFFDKVLKEYRTVVIFISGIGTISMILFFILNFINLGKSQGNPQERQKAITGLIISGIASAGLGSVTLITTLFYNVLK